MTLKVLLIAVIALSLCGCGTMQNLFEGPVVFGGVRKDLSYVWERKYAEALMDRAWDVPFSAIFDILFLPGTLAFEIIRLASGWPPKPGY